MVLNEPETSLHPDLLGALARLIGRASERTQIIVVTHATRLISALAEQSGCHSITLQKILGETTIAGTEKLGSLSPGIGQGVSTKGVADSQMRKELAAVSNH